jgi:hypothetical protein
MAHGGAVKVAELLGKSEAWIYKLDAGGKPSRKLEKLIEQRLGVPRSYWDLIDAQSSGEAA